MMTKPLHELCPPFKNNNHLNDDGSGGRNRHGQVMEVRSDGKYGRRGEEHDETSGEEA